MSEQEQAASTRLARQLVPREPERAVEVLKKCVDETGDAEAMWMLGMLQEYGMGTVQDKSSAQRLYREASKKNDPVGRFLLDHKCSSADNCLLALNPAQRERPDSA